MTDAKINERDKMDEPQAWIEARKLTNLYGNIPSSFTSLIRGLCADQQKGAGLSFSSKWQLNRLLRSESIKIPLYFAHKTFQKSLLERKKEISNDDLVCTFKPLDMAAILGILYLYRRGRHLCDENEWKYIAPTVQTNAEAGAFVGFAMENVGFALGLLVGSMRFLAMACFHLRNAQKFTDYRRQLKVKKMTFSLGMELERWGCTHIQIASTLLIAIGFGSDLAELVCKGYEMDEVGSEHTRVKGYAAKIVDLWTQSLLATGKPPNIAHSGNYYPLKEELARLLCETSATAKSGSQFSWLEKSKDSISADEARGLFKQKASGEAAPPQDEQSEDGVDDLLKDVDEP